MEINQERVARVFSFILKAGYEVFPIMLKGRQSGNIAFRVHPGGKGSNITINQDEVDEKNMAELVLTQGYSVRCSSLDGKVTGMYKAAERSVAEVKII